MTVPENTRIQIAGILKGVDGCAECLRGLHELNGDICAEVHEAMHEARHYLEEAVSKLEDAHARCTGCVNLP